MTSLLDAFVNPKSVVVIGASRDTTSITARPLRYLRDYCFQGEVTVVNPTAVGAEIYGYPVVGSMADAGTADIAMILVPAQRVVQALEECVAAGINRAVVIASGFEGSAGAAEMGSLRALLQRHPALRILGPNCNGSISFAGGVPLSFSSVLLENRPVPGRVGLVMQSGAIGNALLLALARRGVGPSHLFSTGDEFSIGALELTAELLNDNSTDAVALFLEGITDSQNLDRLAEAVAATSKPVFAFRTTASATARVAAFGHTGRLLGQDELAVAALRGAGVRLVQSVEDLCDVATVLSLIPRPGVTPVRVGIVTVSGGAGVIAAEAVGRSGALSLATFTESESDLLAEVVPSGVTIANPLDVPTLGAPEVFSRVLRTAADTGCDAIVAVATTLAHDYDELSRLTVAGDTALVITHLSPEERFTPEQASRLAQSGICTVPSARAAVLALEIWASARQAIADDLRRGPAVREAVVNDAARTSLGMIRGSALLGPAVNRHLAAVQIATDSTKAASIALQIGLPVVLKAEGTEVPHRTERGAVAVGLATAADVAAAFDRIAACSSPDPVVVQAMAAAGIEVFVSVIRDPEVGVGAVLRPGGLLVELFGDSLVLTGPRREWRRSLEESTLGRQLGGWRGAAGADVDALLTIVADLSDAVASTDSIVGIECNPVIVHLPGGGATIVDLVVQQGECS